MLTVKILLVEDDRSIASSVKEGLEASGFSVHHVATGMAALSADEHDMVLLDLGLPDMDGRDVCRQLREVSEVPIIVVSARGEELDRVLPKIPPGVCVAVDDRIAPQLTARDSVVIAGFNDRNASWMVLDLGQKETSLHGPDPHDFARRLPNRGYTLVDQDGRIQLWHKGSVTASVC